MKSEKIVPFSQAQRSTKKDESQSTNSSTSKNRLFESKSKKTYRSYKEMIQAIGKSLKTDKLAASNNMSLTLERKIFKASALDIANAIEQHCDVAKITDGELNSQIFIENPDTYLMTSDFAFMKQILADLSGNTFVPPEQKIQLTVDIADITKTAMKVFDHLENRSSIRPLEKLPSRYVVTKNNKAVDLINRSLVDIDDIRLKYDIVSKINANYVDYSLQTEEEFANSLLNRQVIERIMNQWSEFKEDVEYLYWQIIYATLQNDNHDKFFIIKGPGGNGKSAFMEIIASIVGEKNTSRANIHQFGDPNAINTIGMHTRVIIGDDAVTSFKITDIALSNMKSMSTGQPISVPVKYENNRLVQTNGLLLQGTNTELNFYENNPALSSRAVAIDWCKTDFRSMPKSDLTFDLKHMMTQQSFIDDFFMSCIEKVDYFDDFTIPESIKQATQAMLDSNDTTKQYLDSIMQDINCYESVPLRPLYNNYTQWLKQTNPGSRPMKMNSFNRQLEEKAKEYHFEVSTENTRFRSHRNKESLIALLGATEDMFAANQRYLKFDNPITDKEIDEFLSLEELPTENLTYRQTQIIKQAIYDLNKTYLHSIYSNI